MRAHGETSDTVSLDATSPNTGEETDIPVIEEQVRIGTRQVEIGRSRVVKTVHARETTVDEPLVAEEVRVERVAIDPPRFVDEVPAVRHEGDTMIIPVLEERLVVEKRLVVREELRITRNRREYRAPQSIVLRSERVSVERLPPEAGGIAPEKSSTSSKSQQKVTERMLVGVFDSKQQMEAACRDLRDCGIPDDRVQVRSGTAEQALGRSGLAKLDGDAHDTGFFERLFGRIEGDGARRAGLYSEVVRRGGCVVVVDGIGEDRVEEAVQILERHGAYDIDEALRRRDIEVEDLRGSRTPRPGRGRGAAAFPGRILSPRPEGVNRAGRR